MQILPGQAVERGGAGVQAERQPRLAAVTVVELEKALQLGPVAKEVAVQPLAVGDQQLVVRGTVGGLRAPAQRLVGVARPFFQHPPRLDVDQLFRVVFKEVAADLLAVGPLGHGQVFALHLLNFDAQFGRQLGH